MGMMASILITSLVPLWGNCTVPNWVPFPEFKTNIGYVRYADWGPTPPTSGPEPAFTTYNTITVYINCCQYITHCEKPTIYCHLYTTPMYYILNSRDGTQFGMVHFPHKDTTDVIKTDAFAPTIPQSMFKAFLRCFNFNCFTTHYYDWGTSTVFKKWCNCAIKFTRHTFGCKGLIVFKLVHLYYTLWSCNTCSVQCLLSFTQVLWRQLQLDRAPCLWCETAKRVRAATNMWYGIYSVVHKRWLKNHDIEHDAWYIQH